MGREGNGCLDQGMVDGREFPHVVAVRERDKRFQ